MNRETPKDLSALSNAQLVETPCIGVCVIDRERDICKGCGRTIEEIADWTVMSSDERRAIMDELPDRITPRRNRRRSRGRS